MSFRFSSAAWALHFSKNKSALKVAQHRGAFVEISRHYKRGSNALSVVKPVGRLLLDDGNSAIQLSVPSSVHPVARHAAILGAGTPSPMQKLKQKLDTTKKFSMTQSMRKLLTDRAMRQKYGHCFKHMDVRRYVWKCQRMAGKKHRRGDFALDDSLPKPLSFLKLSQSLQLQVLRERAVALSAVLPVLELSDCWALYTGVPGLLCFMTLEVARRLWATAVLLGLPYQLLVQKASEHPQLVLLEPGSVEVQCSQISLLLGLPLRKVARVVATSPNAAGLLTYQPQQLAKRCQCLTSLLGSTPYNILNMMAKEQSWTSMPLNMISGRMAKLLGTVQRYEQPQDQQLPHAASVAVVRQALYKCPSLINFVGTRHLLSTLQALTTTLCIPPSQALLLLSDCPRCIGGLSEACQVREVLDAVSEILQCAASPQSIKVEGERRLLQPLYSKRDRSEEDDNKPIFTGALSLHVVLRCPDLLLQPPEITKRCFKSLAEALRDPSTELGGVIEVSSKELATAALLAMQVPKLLLLLLPEQAGGAASSTAFSQRTLSTENWACSQPLSSRHWKGQTLTVTLGAYEEAHPQSTFATNVVIYGNRIQNLRKALGLDKEAAQNLILRCPEALLHDAPEPAAALRAAREAIQGAEEPRTLPRGRSSSESRRGVTASSTATTKARLSLTAARSQGHLEKGIVPQNLSEAEVREWRRLAQQCPAVLTTPQGSAAWARMHLQDGALQGVDRGLVSEYLITEPRLIASGGGVWRGLLYRLVSEIQLLCNQAGQVVPLGYNSRAMAPGARLMGRQNVEGNKGEDASSCSWVEAAEVVLQNPWLLQHAAAMERQATGRAGGTSAGGRISTDNMELEIVIQGNESRFNSYSRLQPPSLLGGGDVLSALRFVIDSLGLTKPVQAMHLLLMLCGQNQDMNQARHEGRRSTVLGTSSEASDRSSISSSILKMVFRQDDDMSHQMSKWLLPPPQLSKPFLEVVGNVVKLIRSVPEWNAELERYIQLDNRMALKTLLLVSLEQTLRLQKLSEQGLTSQVSFMAALRLPMGSPIFLQTLSLGSNTGADLSEGKIELRHYLGTGTNYQHSPLSSDRALSSQSSHSSSPTAPTSSQFTSPFSVTAMKVASAGSGHRRRGYMSGAGSGSAPSFSTVPQYTAPPSVLPVQQIASAPCSSPAVSHSGTTHLPPVSAAAGSQHSSTTSPTKSQSTTPTADATCSQAPGSTTNPTHHYPSPNKVPVHSNRNTDHKPSIQPPQPISSIRFIPHRPLSLTGLPVHSSRTGDIYSATDPSTISCNAPSGTSCTPIGYTDTSSPARPHPPVFDRHGDAVLTHYNHVGLDGKGKSTRLLTGSRRGAQCSEGVSGNAVEDQKFVKEKQRLISRRTTGHAYHGKDLN
ncbi:hypothetical protein CEUSTIGMA_g6266.t1 [Chlamydomonas eustigma]|uniref:Uncharacterized protein n=1 Tax=Chlamydomonas eustigma TaxID=1157962 RepID=A0A250X7D7_9CHLO|nr:hypothetical protein CEUSTIGMA_g6266.t1 [Chlamydomonas eustigma]|eukprot:GAX78829.1 hypothetical protein CEUSTIGMA_g6266.t1 [Chlamydomonas eustigma]